MKEIILHYDATACYLKKYDIRKNAGVNNNDFNK